MAMVLSRDSGAMDSGKYVRYTSEQVEALERVYTECPKPTSLRRQQLIRECPILSNIEPKQIKVWFQNRRCREKQRKEASKLQSVNKKLNAVNKLLMEENDRLQKQVSQLVSENGVMRQQLHPLPVAAAEGICDSAIRTTHAPPHDSSNPAGLLSIAEDTLAEFLAKATGTAVDWIQMPGMKPGPDSVGIFAISQTCNGVAARAFGLVSLEPLKIAELLKDRLSWLRDCRTLEVFTMFPSGKGATIELIYSQMYAPTTLAPARDFWSIRYSTTLENGSLVVCERSLSGSGPNPPSPHFVRGEILPSGYLIRPCDGGGSIVHIVDHFNLQAWSVPEVLRPLYESSKNVAQRITIAALRYVREIAQEASGDVPHGFGRQPAVLRSLRQRLTRGFNDAVCGFTDDGWSSLNCNGAEDIIISIRSLNSIPNIGGIVSAKASMLLQNVPPATLIRFLRVHRSEWADFNVDAFTAASFKSGSQARASGFSGNQTIMPLGHTLEQDEILEVVRLEGHSLALEGAFVGKGVHLLQICRGIDENSDGACAEMIFAPMDDTFPDDAPLFPSGFCVIPLESKSKDSPNSNRTLDLASTLEANSTHADTSNHIRSVLTIAFQFPFESNLHESVAMMARQYMRSVISSVQRVATAISPLPDTKLSPTFPEALTLIQWICQSYTHHIGEHLLVSNSPGDDAVSKSFWQHKDAILCCSVKASPVLVFANQAGLDMLETTLVGVQEVALERILEDGGRKILCGEFAKIQREGFAYLPGGTCVSTMNRRVSYERCVSWKVHSVEVSAVHCLAFLFENWLFV